MINANLAREKTKYYEREYEWELREQEYDPESYEEVQEKMRLEKLKRFLSEKVRNALPYRTYEACVYDHEVKEYKSTKEEIQSILEGEGFEIQLGYFDNDLSGSEFHLVEDAHVPENEIHIRVCWEDE